MNRGPIVGGPRPRRSVAATAPGERCDLGPDPHRLLVLENGCDQGQILDQGGHFFVAALLISLAEDGARVDRRGDVRGEVGVEPAASFLRDPELLAEE